MTKGWPSSWTIAAWISFLTPSALALEPEAVFAKASQSVVVILSKTESGRTSLGSGVVLRGDTVATNCHVIANASRIDVQYGNSAIAASVLRKDTKRDICLLRVQAKNLRPATFADPKGIRPGMRVYSIGSPQGLDLTISEGLVSGIRVTESGTFIQTSAAISHGSSGGGLFNQEAALVGFTTFFLKDGQNLNFAVPAVAALNLLADFDNALVRPSGNDNIELRDSVASAISAAANRSPSPAPSFGDPAERMKYARWLGAMSERLKSRNFKTASPEEFLDIVWYESMRAGLEPALVLGLIEAASKFRKYAVGVAGARGYMQVAEAWSKTIGDGDHAKLFHTQSNLRFGCVILRHYSEKGNGDIYTALVWYFGQSMNKDVGLTNAAAKSFAGEVLSARQRWVFDQ